MTKESYAGDNANRLDRSGCRSTTWEGLGFWSKQKVPIRDEKRQRPKHRHSPEFKGANELHCLPQFLHHLYYSHHIYKIRISSKNQSQNFTALLIYRPALESPCRESQFTANAAVAQYNNFYNPKNQILNNNNNKRKMFYTAILYSLLIYID